MIETRAREAAAALLPELDLAELRQAIDHLNGQILELVQRRAAVVVEIARHKQALGLPAHDPWREEEMLGSLVAAPSGPLGPAEVREVFRAIFRASLELHARVRRGAATDGSR